MFIYKAQYPDAFYRLASIATTSSICARSRTATGATPRRVFRSQPTTENGTGAPVSERRSR